MPDLTTQPLPQNTFSPSHLCEAYGHCLELEKLTHWELSADFALAQTAPEHNTLAMPPDVVARVLGYALLYAPNEIGRDALARDIVDCRQDQQLLAGLVFLYVFGLARVFRNPSGPTPSATPPFPPGSMRWLIAQQLDLVEPPDPNFVELRELTLHRDNFRCVFTGVLDNHRHLDVVGPDDRTSKVGYTHTAHIISQPLAQRIEGTTKLVRDKFTWSTTAAAILEHFGGFSAEAAYLGESLHNPKNALTTSLDSHIYFDTFWIWLTPTTARVIHSADIDATGERMAYGPQQVIKNTYDVGYVGGRDRLRQIRTKDTVTFRDASVTRDGQVVSIPAPDPNLLAVHAACARTLHMSGAAEYLEEFFKELDHIGTMTDPNAAEELTRALRNLQVTSTG